MESALLLSLLTSCAPQVNADTARALIAVESSSNPHAIGVVAGALERQPRHRAEALVTATALQAAGYNFSLGLGQINVRNLSRLGLTLQTALDPCTNLAAMQSLLVDCYSRSLGSLKASHAQRALRQALSCYYSGNFTTGFRDGYVRKVVAAARLDATASMEDNK